jgi:hypothetical protein
LISVLFLATDFIGQLGRPVRAVQSGKARQLMAQRHLYIHIFTVQRLSGAAAAAWRQRRSGDGGGVKAWRSRD